MIGIMRPASAADMTIRFAWYMPPHTATAMLGNTVAQDIEQMSNGKIKVQTYPSGSLLDESAIGQGIVNNTVNMGIMGMHWWADKEPALNWDTIPFLVNNASDLLKALHGRLGQKVNHILNKHGIEIVGWGFYGYAGDYVNSQHPIKKPADLKGLKMRSDGRLSASFLKSQGAVPVAMDSSEVYTALQRHALDGAVSGMSAIIARKWYEVGQYITAIHYEPLVYPVMANLKWWKGLSQQQRNTISKATASAEQANLAEIEKEFKQDIVTARKQSDQVYEPDAKTLKQWKAATLSLSKSGYLAAAGKQGKEILTIMHKALRH
jgi:TRAP-type C4-dicarboxylate transport system substrate-binding protein